MKYMLMMNTPSGGDYQIFKWAPDDIQRHMDFMHAINKKLRDAGELVDINGLSPPSQAKLVRGDKNGKPITDGVFAESKEFLAGYWIVDVESPERAYAIAGEVSLAPGPGGKPLFLGLEVRQVMEIK